MITTAYTACHMVSAEPVKLSKASTTVENSPLILQFVRSTCARLGGLALKRQIFSLPQSHTTHWPVHSKQTAVAHLTAGTLERLSPGLFDHATASTLLILAILLAAGC